MTHIPNLMGYKGGSDGSQRQPVESPDSLVSNERINIVDLVSEGDIVGLVNGVDSIFLDEAPGSSYPSLQWDYRLGTQDQSYMQGFPNVQSEIQVGVVLQQSAPYIRAVTNTTVSALRLNFALGRFAQQNPSNGDTKGVRVEFAIDLAQGPGEFQEIMRSAFDGKTTTSYTRSVRVDLTYPAPANGWRVRVRRLTPNATTSNISDAVTIRSVTEIVDYKFRYPNSAVFGLSFDAEAFAGKIPKRSYHIRGRIVKVPSNYDPASRTYGGVWDGGFKPAWTNNPVWVYYDLLLNERFGLGDRISANQIDKWGLYEISQYCDQMVDDGKGGKEPRFTCNLFLQKQAAALKVLQDIAAIFRGITYWGLGQAIVSADMPRDPVYVYTNANVINGRFNRKGAKKSTIYSVVLSAWNDPTDFFRTKYEYVQDDALVAKYGVRTMTLANLGCTSQGQAHRAAKWALLSNQYETNTVTFSTGLEGIKAMPGQVVRIVDQFRQGRRVGGRVRDGSTTTTIRVDVLPNINVGVGDALVLNMPNGESATRVVTSVNYGANTVTVGQPFPNLPVKGGVWAYEAEDLKSELYRIVSISEGSSPLEYNITALTYTEGKHENVDFGTIISTRPTVVVPVSVVPAPQNVQMFTDWKLDQYQAVTTLTISWDRVIGAVRYDVEWKRDNTDWIYAGRVATTEVDVVGVYAGEYSARVRAVNAVGVLSPWTTIGPQPLQGKTDPPPVPVNVRTTPEIFAIRLDWDFPQGAEDTAFSQIQISDSQEGANTIDLGQFSYPTTTYLNSGMAAGVLKFFRVRLIDKTGNVGDWSEWVNGRSSADADAILDYIQGQITESEIGKELLDRIDLIDQDGPGSVNDRLNTVRTELEEQVSEVDQQVISIRNDLQEQIDQIGELSDSMPYKGDKTYTAGMAVLGVDGVLYQAKQNVPINTPPPNGTYWTDIGQVVQQSGALASRVLVIETEITSIDNELTSQAQQINGLRTSIDGKADSTLVDSLTSRVTQNETSISTMGQSITGLNNSLVVTNDNVAAAQSAANAANTLAGGKGKVIYGSTTPVAADRLTQNIWIDTNNNANTPKRWNGTAWVAVTDKVATDAAAAAAAATALAQTKADASTVQSLSNLVSQQGQDITAAGQAITSINTSLSSVGAENLLYNPSFDTPTPGNAGLADGWYWRTQAGIAVTPSLLASTLTVDGKRQRLEITGLVAGGGSSYVDFAPTVAPKNTRPPAYPGVVGTASIYARGTPGLIVQIYMQYRNSADIVTETNGPVNMELSAAESFSRFSLNGTAAPAGTVRVDVLYRIRPAPGSSVTSGFVEFDNAQYEYSPIVTGWRNNGQVNAADILLNADATTALTARVGITESGLTSTSLQLTELNNTIGDAGGENLVYNPTFNKYTSLTGAAEGWEVEGPAPSTDTLVVSWMNSAERAQRIAATGLTNSSTYRSLRATTPKQINVAADQVVTISAYVRRIGSDAVNMRIFAVFVNASGTGVGSPASNPVAITSQGGRVQFTTTAPANAARVQIYFRAYGPGTAGTPGTVEIARPQVEYASRATGWSDNGQVNSTAIAANSSAVDSLSSLVSQQGTTLTSVSGRTTALENSVNSTTNGLSTKASTSSVTALGNRVTATEGALTAQGQQLTSIESRIGGISPFVAGKSWEFLNSTQGWIATASTGTITAGPMFATVTNNPNIQNNFTPAVSGSSNPYLRIRMRRRNTNRTNARMYWANEDGGLAEARRADFIINITTTDWQDLEVDLTDNAAWVGKNMTSIRLDLMNASDPNGVIDIAYIAVGRRSAAASALAVNDLSTIVTQIDGKVTAQAQQLTSLTTDVGGVQTSVQNLSSTVNTLNGQASATNSTKVAITSNGIRYVAGFGVGIDNNSGVVQSNFVVMADRFSVMNASGNGFILPFVIQNGQVFIRDALISKLAVTSAIVGSYVYSAAMSTWGGPIMQQEFNAGYIRLLHATRNATYTELSRTGLNVIVDGVLRVRMGAWD